MKSFKSAVFSVVASLFLVVSLSGCLGDEKTASQGGENGSVQSDSGDFKLVLKPGAEFVLMSFPERASAEKRSEGIRAALEAKGVIIEHLVVSGDSTQGTVAVRVGQIGAETVLTLEKGNLASLTVESTFGKVIALWEPSFGGDVKYIS